MAEYRMLDREPLQKGDEWELMSSPGAWLQVGDHEFGKPRNSEHRHRRPLPERGEEFEEWHRRECPLSYGGTRSNVCHGNLTWQKGPGFPEGWTFGRTCREVWESERGAAPKPTGERFVGVDRGKDDGTAVATGHRTPDGKVVIEDVRYIPPGVTVAPVPQSVLLEHGQPLATAAMTRCCPSCGSALPWQARCPFCCAGSKPVFGGRG